MQTNYKTLLSTLLILVVVSSFAEPLKERINIPHFSKCYTQGLIIQGNDVWESCGSFGESQLMHWQLDTQKVIKQVKFDDKYFAEGLAEIDGR